MCVNPFTNDYTLYNKQQIIIIVTLLSNILIIWLGPNFMEQSPSWEADSHSADQEVLHENPRFITAFKRARQRMEGLLSFSPTTTTTSIAPRRSSLCLHAWSVCTSFQSSIHFYILYLSFCLCVRISNYASIHSCTCNRILSYSIVSHQYLSYIVWTCLSFPVGIITGLI
jgi:hypothetical protein